jgi:hypothetical protein
MDGGREVESGYRHTCHCPAHVQYVAKSKLHQFDGNFGTYLRRDSECLP